MTPGQSTKQNTNAYLKWLRKGLRPHLAKHVRLDNLELIIENGRAFNIMYDALVSSAIAEPGNTWAKTPFQKDVFQLLPIHYKSVSFPSRYRVATYPGCVSPAGVHCLVKIFMAHPYMRKAGDDCTRIMLFGQKPENMLILAVHTDRRQEYYTGRDNTTHGRTHKSYVYNGKWIHYGYSIPKPTMGYKIRLPDRH